MRIGIDATSLLLRSAGIKSYTWHWLEALRAIAPESIHAFPFLPPNTPLYHEGSVLPALATYPRLALLYAVNTLPLMDLIAQRWDVFHCSNQVRRPPQRCLLTATVHDLTCWLMPDLHTAANVRADRNFADRVLRRAAGLIAVSENTRRDAIRVLGIAPERIRTIHLGVAESYFKAIPLRAAKPYALFVGTIEPRKNIDLLLDAWQSLPLDLREQYELRIAGPIGWSAGGTAARLGEVRYMGYVAESELPALVAGATLFAYPSLYEGFGLPVAQAMAAGIPIVTSNLSSLPEVAGDAAVLVDPRSVTELVAALSRVLTSPALRDQLSAAARQRAQLYRWSRHAAESLNFFAQLG